MINWNLINWTRNECLVLVLMILVALVVVIVVSVWLHKQPGPAYECRKCGKITTDWEVVKDPDYQWGDYEFITVCRECSDRIAQNEKHDAV